MIVGLERVEQRNNLKNKMSEWYKRNRHPEQNKTTNDNEDSIDKQPTSQGDRLLPPPICVPTQDHKAVLIDDFDKGADDKEAGNLDYYEEIRKKPIKVLMTREISRYYGREAYLVTTIKEILVYIIFLIVLSILVLENPTSEKHTLLSSMVAIFTKNNFSLIYDHREERLLKLYENLKLTFKDINTISHVWAYLTHRLPVSIKELDIDRNKESDSQALESDMHENLLLGSIRLRQLRVKTDICKAPENIEDCTSYYHEQNEDKGDFGPPDHNETAWSYTPEEETKMFKIHGEISTYGGGGFYDDYKKEKLRQDVDSLRKGSWIDRKTRAVIVDLSVYNANLNIFCVIKILFEMPPTGGVIPSFRAHPIRLFAFRNQGWSDLIFVMIFIMFFVYFTIEELYEMLYFKWEFITSFWNYLDVAVVTMSYFTIILNLFLYVNVEYFLQDVNMHSPKFVNLDLMASVDKAASVSLALLIFLCWFKFLKYVCINYSMFQLQRTFELVAGDILSFSFMFLTVLFALAFLGFMLFGDQIQDYCTFGLSLWALIRAGMGDFDYLALERANPILGPLFFALWLSLISFYFIVMYLAILLDKYAEVRKEISNAPQQLKIGDIFQMWLVDFLRTFPHKLANRVMNAFNKKKKKHKFQDVQFLLKRCGFTELEIDMFLAKYQVSNARVITEDDINNVMKNLKHKGLSPEHVARVVVRQTVEEKVDAAEAAVKAADEKVTAVLAVLSFLEQRMSLPTASSQLQYW